MQKLVERAIDNACDRKMVKFKEYFRNTDVLLIDDIQFMNGKEAMQE